VPAALRVEVGPLVQPKVAENPVVLEHVCDNGGGSAERASERAAASPPVQVLSLDGCCCCGGHALVVGAVSCVWLKNDEVTHANVERLQLSPSRFPRFYISTPIHLHP
jgi:hypothetical protein